MGTHLRELSEGIDGFQKSLHPCSLDESSLSTGRVKETYTDINKVEHTSQISPLKKNIKPARKDHLHTKTSLDLY